MIYLQREHRVSLAVAIPVDFSCRACGFETELGLRRHGSGFNNSPMMLDDSVSGALAEDAARVSAWQLAQQGAALLPCPRCKKRDWWKVVRFFGGSLLSMAGVATVLCGLAFAFDPRVVPLIAGFMGLATPLVVVMSWWRARVPPSDILSS